MRIEYNTTEPILAVGRGTNPADSQLAHVLKLTPDQTAASRRRSMPRGSGWHRRGEGAAAGLAGSGAAPFNVRLGWLLADIDATPGESYDRW